MGMVYGKVTPKLYDLLPLMMWHFANVARYYGLKQTMERLYGLLLAMKKLYSHIARFYHLAQIMAQFAARNRGLARFWHRGTAVGAVGAKLPWPHAVGSKVLQFGASGAAVLAVR
jgi:hypothetical protein